MDNKDLYRRFEHVLAAVHDDGTERHDDIRSSVDDSIEILASSLGVDAAVVRDKVSDYVFELTNECDLYIGLAIM